MIRINVPNIIFSLLLLMVIIYVHVTILNMDRTFAKRIGKITGLFHE